MCDDLRTNKPSHFHPRATLLLFLCNTSGTLHLYLEVTMGEHLVQPFTSSKQASFSLSGSGPGVWYNWGFHVFISYTLLIHMIWDITTSYSTETRTASLSVSLGTHSVNTPSASLADTFVASAGRGNHTVRENAMSPTNSLSEDMVCETWPKNKFSAIILSK